jgi:hypothetical protein
MTTHLAAEQDVGICQPGTAADNFVDDPEFDSRAVPLSDAELADLHRSLDTYGCLDPVLVWQGHDLIVDGRNRLRHCRAKGYPFPVRYMDFPDRQAVMDYISTLQLGRRDLSLAAESYFRGKRYLQEKRQGARTDLAGGPAAGKTTAQRLGEEAGVSARTVWSAKECWGSDPAPGRVAWRASSW